MNLRLRLMRSRTGRLRTSGYVTIVLPHSHLCLSQSMESGWFRMRNWNRNNRTCFVFREMWPSDEKLNLRALGQHPCEERAIMRSKIYIMNCAGIVRGSRNYDLDLIGIKGAYVNVQNFSRG